MAITRAGDEGCDGEAQGARAGRLGDSLVSRQTDAGQQRVISRIVSESVEQRTESDATEFRVPDVTGFLQPVKGVVAIVERRVHPDPRHRVTRTSSGPS